MSLRLPKDRALALRNKSLGKVKSIKRKIESKQKIITIIEI